MLSFPMKNVSLTSHIFLRILIMQKRKKEKILFTPLLEYIVAQGVKKEAW